MRTHLKDGTLMVLECALHNTFNEDKVMAADMLRQFQGKPKRVKSYNRPGKTEIFRPCHFNTATLQIFTGTSYHGRWLPASRPDVGVMTKGWTGKLANVVAARPGVPNTRRRMGLCYSLTPKGAVYVLAHTDNLSFWTKQEMTWLRKLAALHI